MPGAVGTATGKDYKREAIEDYENQEGALDAR